MRLGRLWIEESRKVATESVLPPFCRMLGQCGIATSCITDFRSLGQELEISEGVPTVLISLIHETYDDLDEYDILEDLLKQANAIFNSHRTAGVMVLGNDVFDGGGRVTLEAHSAGDGSAAGGGYDFVLC